MPKVKKEYKYHYFYQITNLLNNYFYYGIHSTNNLDDGYMGSGSRLNYAYKKYGIENFEKKILKYFNTRKECAEYEAEIVTEELVHNPNCYNVSCGGEYFNTLGTVTVKDKNGNYFRCDKNDPKYLNGEYISNYKGLITCYDNILNKWISITTKLYHENKDRYKTNFNKSSTYFDKQLNKNVLIENKIAKENSDRYININKNKTTFKDKNGNYFSCDINDPRVLSGELKFMWTGRKHKKESIDKVKETYKKIKHQQGEKNSQYGTCWINKDNKNLKIKKEELENYLNNGWIKGRKMPQLSKPSQYKRYWVTNGEINHYVTELNIEKYLAEGWKKGRTILKK